MTTSHDSGHHHDNAHALGKGATIALLVITVVGCLIGIYAGLIIGEHARL